jgi:prepilin signal peptidase PulO-like enzyme (type II secretory pathway)
VGELLLGVVFVLTTIRFDVSLELVLMLFFVCILYFVSVTDIYDQIIPNGAIITALVVRVIWHVVFELFLGGSPDIMVTVRFLIDGLAVSLPLFLLVLFMEKLWKKEAMGGGDIKLLFIVGLYLGWEKTLLTLLFACIVGIIGGTIQLRRQEDGYFAFGPYIAIAAVLSLLIGDGLIEWYLSLF